MGIIIKELPASELGRIIEIDRSEHVTVLYHTRDGELVPEEVDLAVPAGQFVALGGWSVFSSVSAASGRSGSSKRRPFASRSPIW